MSELQRLCKWALDNGFSTGHADDMNMLLDELLPQLTETQAKLEKAEKVIETQGLSVKWMKWWLDNQECDCESVHVCGKTERIHEFKQIELALADYKDSQPDQEAQ